MNDGLVFFFVRQTLAVFLGFMGLFLGYLLGWAAFLSLPGGWEGHGGIYRYGGMSIGAAAGCLLAWWQSDAGARFRLAAALVIVSLAVLGAWLGYSIRPQLHSNSVSEGVRQFTPTALGAVVGANLAAMVMYYIRQAMGGRSASHKATTSAP